MTFNSTYPVGPEQVQEAILRAVRTKAFGIAGTIQVHVQPLNVVSKEAETLARPGICPARGCDAPLTKKKFFCGTHFKMLPRQLQVPLEAAKDVPVDVWNANEAMAKALADVVMAGVGTIAAVEGGAATRDEQMAMAKFQPADGNA